MKFLALEHDLPAAVADQFAPLLRPEAQRVWELYRSGIIRELYFRADRRDAVLILECLTPADARQALDNLPLVRAGLVEFELIPLIPYDGFSRLFTGT
jgi:hypothetical protein